VASGVFGAEESLPSLYPVATGDFDGDGQVDLVHDSSSSRTVTFFDNGLAVNPGVVVGANNFNDWPAVDVDRDGRTDLLTPTTARDALGVLAGQSSRGFAARFQSSVSVPADSGLLVALPPAPRTFEKQEYFDAADSSLRQLGVIYKNEGSGAALCRVGLDTECALLEDALPGLSIEEATSAIITDPFFRSNGGTNAYVTAYAAKATATAFRLRSTPTGFTIEPVPVSQEIFESNDQCAACGVGTCSCATTSARGIFAMRVVPTEPNGSNFVLAAAVAFKIGTQEYLGAFITGLEAGTAFTPVNTVESALPLNGNISRIELGDLDGNPGTTEFIVRETQPDASYCVFLGKGAIADCPDGNYTVGDVNGDGFEDVIGADSESTVGGVIYFGGIDLPLTKAPLVIEGYNPELYVADLDGNGIKDVVVTTTPAPEAGLERSLVIHFGRPFDVPAPPVSLGSAPNRQVLPIKLQVKSSVDFAGETAVSDGIDDLAILQSGDSASFVTGDINGYPLSPYFFAKDVRDKLKLAETDLPLLVSTIALPNRATATEQGEPPPPNEDEPIALLTFLVISGEKESYAMLPLFARSGQLSLNSANATSQALDLGGAFPVSDAVFYDRAKTKFGVVAAADYNSGKRTVLLLSLDGATLTLGKSVEVDAFIGEDGGFIEPRILTSSLPPVSEDSTLWLLQRTEEGTSLTSLTDVIEPFALDTKDTGVQWLGPHSAQIGTKVVDFRATLASDPPKLVEDTCLKADKSFFDPLLHTSAFYLTGNGLPDRVRLSPVSIAPQLEGTTCEAIEASNSN
jgi:hypothetical protein